MLPVHKRPHSSYYQVDLCSLIRFTEMFTSTPISSLYKMCSLLVENVPDKAKAAAVDLEHLMSETEPARKEGKLDLVDPDGNSEFVCFFVGNSVSLCSVLT